MKTSELIEFLATQDFTDTQALNLLINDLYDFVPMEQVEGAQRLVEYYNYKMTEVLLATIHRLRKA